MLIKLVVLDIDGVLVGEKNPMPSKNIIGALRQVAQKGIKVVLNTSKPIFASGIKQIVKAAGLNNLHITFSGAMISEAGGKKVLEEKSLDMRHLLPIFENLRNNKIFFEAHTRNGYYIERKTAKNFNYLLPLRKKVIGKSPITLKSFKNLKVFKPLKVMVIVWHNRKKRMANRILATYKKINFGWSRHPAMVSMRLGQITAGGVSKKSAVKKLMKYYKVSKGEILGVGDTILDWDFLAECDYVSIPEDADSKLKKLVKLKKRGRFFISPTVNNEGIIKVFENFGIL